MGLALLRQPAQRLADFGHTDLSPPSRGQGEFILNSKLRFLHLNII
jgi:hypothetical protein